MKSNPTLKILCASLSFSLMACSGGGGTILQGAQCSLKKPISMDVGAGQSKLELGQAPTTLTAGTYVRTKVDLYYEELAPNAKDNFRIWIEEQKKSDFSKNPKTSESHSNVHLQAVPSSPSDGKQVEDPFETRKLCLRNSSNIPENLNVRVKAVTEMVVDQNASVSSTVSEYGFHLDDQKMIVTDTIPKPDEKPSLPGNIYEGATDKFLLKLSDQDYEIRSTGSVLDAQGAVRGTYYLSVTYHRQ